MPPPIIPKTPAPRNPRLTNPCACSPISTDHDIVGAQTLTTTATAACLITVIPCELVAFPLPVSGSTSIDFGLNSQHVLVLENGQAASGCWISTAVTAGAGSRARVRLLEGFEGSKSIVVVDLPVQSNHRLSSHSALGVSSAGLGYCEQYVCGTW